MSILGKIADAAALVLTKVTGLSRPSAWSTRVARRLSSMSIKVSDDLDYEFVASSRLLLWRGQTLFQKEPETISWIRSFSGDDIFFDVGANVGVFTIYAGRRGARVYAFEPESSNFSILNRNIVLNKLSARVTAFAIAVSERSKVDTLRLASLDPGSALHAFGTDFDFKGDRFAAIFEQGCLAMSLDDLVVRHGLPQPTRLKVDVDGLERAVIAGATKVINDPRLREILIEINENDPADQRMIRNLEEAGFDIVTKGKPVTDAAGNYQMSNIILRRRER